MPAAGTRLGPAGAIYVNKKFVTAEVTGRQGKTKFLNIHNKSEGSTRSCSFIVKERVRGKPFWRGAAELSKPQPGKLRDSCLQSPPWKKQHVTEEGLPSRQEDAFAVAVVVVAEEIEAEQTNAAEPEKASVLAKKEQGSITKPDRVT